VQSRENTGVIRETMTDSIILVTVGASTNGKSGDFGSPMWRFESSRPSHDTVNMERKSGSARFFSSLKVEGV
jgi:hypothetical protein